MHMLGNALLFAALCWTAYKAYNADDRDEATFYVVYLIIPIVLLLCGVQFADIDD